MVQEWLSEPVVHIKDIRTRKVIEFPKTQATETSSNLEVVHNTDDHETDANILVVSLKDLKEQQQHEVSVPSTDTLNSSPWKYVGQGVGRVYIPPELDADTGKKIESIHEETKEPRRIIIKRAVDLLHNHILRIPNYLGEESKVLPTRVGAVVSLPKVEEEQRGGGAEGQRSRGEELLINNSFSPAPLHPCSPAPEASPTSPAPEASPTSPALKSSKGIPDDVYIALQQAGIDLGLGTAQRLWTKYSDKFVDVIAYTKAQDEAGKSELPTLTLRVQCR